MSSPATSARRPSARTLLLSRAAALLRTGFALGLGLLEACQPRAQRKPTAHTAELWPALNEHFLASAAATSNYRLGRPQPLAITRGGRVLFRRTEARDRRADLFALEPDGQVRKLLSVEQLLAGASETLSADEQARRERSRTITSGIVDIGVSDDGSRLLVPLGERLFLVQLDSERVQVRELDPGAGFPFDPKISPDGRHVAFVRDSDLWLLELDSGAVRRLTQHEPGIELGTAEFVAQEELDRKSGYLWAPDSQSLIFQRTDARKVDTLYVSDPRHPVRQPVPFKYPRPGTNNAVVDLGSISLQPGAAVRWLTWDVQRYPYLAKLNWSRHAPLTALVLSRDQHDASLLAIDPETGAMRELLHEHDDAWLNLTPGSPTWLDDGSGFLWLNEQPAGYVLELHAADGGRLRALTSPELGARAIYGAMPGGGPAIIAASRDPRQQHVLRVPLDGAAALPLTAAERGGVHSAIADHGVVVISSELRDGGGECFALMPDGRRHELPSVAERPELVPTTQLESVSVRGRELYTSITRPQNFDASRRYPVLVRVYGGPHVSNVLDARNAYLLDQFYADAGFIVLRADGRGTPNRGHDFERAIYRDLVTVPLEDQVGALQAMISRHPELDGSRVGIFGWSFGGYLSGMAALLRPDVFKAAVMGAPVTDWALYDTAYTERYMQTPQQNPGGYAHASALTHAAQLRRPLLLMHGLTDDNVHFAHALALIEALYTVGKVIDVVALSSTHMVVDPKLNFVREQVQVEFFRRHLGLSSVKKQ
jgi:dipeptidyl-peptidase-4